MKRPLDVLIVEDEKKIRELLVEYFQDALFHPFSLDRGDVARQAI